MEIIPREALDVGMLYRVHGKQFTVGIWTGSAFLGRTKENGVLRYREERHWDEGQPRGTCSPTELLSSLTMPSPWEGQSILVLLDLIEDCLITVDALPDLTVGASDKLKEVLSRKIQGLKNEEIVDLLASEIPHYFLAKVVK